MAWTEQCKIAMRSNAHGKLAPFKNKNRKVAGVLRDLSKESDIPFKTLERWFYEKDSISLINGGDSDEDESKAQPCAIEIPTCSLCNKHPVYLRKCGKPLSEESKYYGLCPTCRRNQQYIEVIDREATNLNMGVMTVCPSCNHPHYVSIDRIEHLISKYNKVIKDEH